jgi:hypothetical protein
MPAPRHSSWLVVATLVVVVLAAARDADAQSCDADHTIRWPETNPVWQLCWVSPPNSSGIDGSGLEITSVSYNGKLVLARGHIPIVNVIYDPGGCGGPDLSYRDWNAELAVFEANNVIRPGYAEPTVPPRTVCDHPGADIGTFKGVAAEKLADRLILTTQVQAGWYRYIYTWTFFLDGTLQPGVRFTAVDNPCTSMPHYHNIYWRLDFDIDGAANDAIEEYNSGTWSTLTTEAQRLHAPTTTRKWRVRDKVTGTGYELTPGATADVANSWSVADFWALLYRSSEGDDGGATGGLDGDKAHIDQYVNGENIDGKDVVLWYRAGFRHDGPADCELGGPMLVPLAASRPTLSIGDVTLNEGNSGTSNAVFTVNLSGLSSSAVSVNYATGNGTATAGSDYVANSGTLTFAPGTTGQTVTVAVNGDTTVEANETFVVNLSGASNADIADGQGQGTILNDDTSVGLAVYDSTLKAPRCGAVGGVCDSGPTLLNGRDGKGPEPNQPNTINGSCADGIEGAYHYDESLDRLKVSTLDGSSFAPGKTVKLEATVWAWTNSSLDKLELYYAASVSNSSWQLIATLTPPVGGAQTLSATYALPSGTLQAVRGRFRFLDTAGACGTGDFDDHDDLIFAVDAAPPPADGQPPTTAITSPQNGASVSATFTITASADDNIGVTRVEFYIDGVLRSTDTTAPYTYAWNTTTVGNGSHGIVSRAYDAANNLWTSATVNANVNNQTALFDSVLKVPKCGVLSGLCDSGPVLLNGRDGKGPEPNQPNSINGLCRDGIEGAYHYDESNDRIRVFTNDGSPFAAGKAVTVQATVWAWTNPSLDKLELYYAANANSPSWQLIATLTPSVGGAQTLSAAYVLPTGTLQAVRARFRFLNSAGACGTGDFDDHDDLVFTVR